MHGFVQTFYPSRLSSEAVQVSDRNTKLLSTKALFETMHPLARSFIIFECFVWNTAGSSKEHNAPGGYFTIGSLATSSKIIRQYRHKTYQSVNVWFSDVILKLCVQFDFVLSTQLAIKCKVYSRENKPRVLRNSCVKADLL